jgi:hypothetical protein
MQQMRNGVESHLGVTKLPVERGVKFLGTDKVLFDKLQVHAGLNEMMYEIVDFMSIQNNQFRWKTARLAYLKWDVKYSPVTFLTAAMRIERGITENQVRSVVGALSVIVYPYTRSALIAVLIELFNGRFVGAHGKVFHENTSDGRKILLLAEKILDHLWRSCNTLRRKILPGAFALAGQDLDCGGQRQIVTR